MPLTIDHLADEANQRAGTAFATGISQAAHGLDYGVVLYAFGKIVAAMSARTEAGTVRDLTDLIRTVAQAVLDQEAEDGTRD